MSKSAYRERDSFDDLLDKSTPATTAVDAVIDAELARMVVGARAYAPTVERRRKWARPTVIGLAAALVFGGAATAAAAATGFLWSPWAQQPDAVLTYTLPSGAVCESRLGDVNGADPAGREAVKSFLRTTDLDALIHTKIDATIATMRTEVHTFTNADGSEEPAGFGTDHYSADAEYDAAVSRIVGSALEKSLLSQGIDLDAANLAYAGEANCPGAAW